jgi:hypothetical protein
VRLGSVHARAAGDPGDGVADEPGMVVLAELLAEELAGDLDGQFARLVGDL